MPINLDSTNISNNIEWRGNSPFSTLYNDIYFSQNNSIAETEYVFLQHNQLATRFAELRNKEKFTIIETGFGTGLNFLCSWRLFTKTNTTAAKLNFISIEKHPLTKAQLEFCFKNRLELQEYAKELLKVYNPSTSKFKYSFSPQVTLTVYFIDITAAINQIRTKANAWFLDGFAPAKNPEMWSQNLFDWMATNSLVNASLATFTAAKIVKQGLQQAGFEIKKCKGFGYKRDMITGRIKKSKTVTQPWDLQPQQNNTDKKAIIIGAGLAGISCAYELAQRNWQVTVLDSSNKIASGASGNLQGVLYAKLATDNNNLNSFIEAALEYSIDKFSKFGRNIFYKSGVVQLAKNQTEIERYKIIANKFKSHTQLYDYNKLSAIAKLALNSNGLFFKDCGWVNVVQLCNNLATNNNIIVKNNFDVIKLQQNPNNQWEIISSNGESHRAATVIFAQGHLSSKLAQTNYLPLKSIRGQVTYVEATKQSKLLTTAVCADGYITPATVNNEGEEFHSVGATFDLHETTLNLLETSHKKNLDKLLQYFPQMHMAFNDNNPNILGGRVGFRCTTPDYLPVVGAIVNKNKFINNFASLATNAKRIIYNEVPYLTGLYVSSGHGSRGLISCLFSANLLAKIINNEDYQDYKQIIATINPSRFLVRDIKRRKANL